MGARFIKKSDGNFYMRLDGNTTQVKFAAVSESSNTYTFSVAGTQRVSKPNDDGSTTYYTSSASPTPSGATLDDDASRFPGAETTVTYSRTPGGVDDYLLSFTAGPTPGTAFYLGGESLTWGGYAYPGDGYLNNAFNLGVKDGGSWKNVGSTFIKDNGVWKECEGIWVKQGGSWKQFFANYGNSSWICMLERTDDAIDFCVQVIALNNVFTSLDPNSSQFTRSLSVPSSITNTSWSSFMRTYAVWPYPGQTNTGILYTSTWTIDVTVAGNYILEVQADNSGQISFDNVVVASSISFTTSTIVNLNNVTAGTHTVSASIVNANNNAPSNSDWNVNPAGIAWRISPN